MQLIQQLPGMIAHHSGAEFTEGLVSRLGLRVSGFKFEIRDSKLETFKSWRPSQMLGLRFKSLVEN